MVKNSAAKKAARAYQAEHPGMTYPEAKRLSQAEYATRKAARESEAESQALLAGITYPAHMQPVGELEVE